MNKQQAMRIRSLAKNNRKRPTDAEKILWRHLRNRKLCGFKFKRQHKILNYIVDFICIEKKLAIELDGSQHGNDENQRLDEARSLELAKQGIETLRIWNRDVLLNTEAVLSWILERVR